MKNKPYQVCYGTLFIEKVETLEEALKVAEGVKPGRYSHVTIWRGRMRRGRFTWRCVKKIPK